MSVNVQRYKADSNKLVGYLIPFFLRGTKVLRFMSAICSPLNDVNERLLSWAQELITEAVATSQPVVLKWFLNEKLRIYFKDSDAEFQLMVHDSSEMFVYEDQEELAKYQNIQDIYMLENIDDTALSETDNKIQLVTYDSEIVEVSGDSLTIVAPAHNSLIRDIEYSQKINYWIDRYLVNSVKYNIIIN